MEHHLRDVCGFFLLIRRGDNGRSLAVLFFAEQLLVVLAMCFREYVIGEIKDGLRRTVIMLELEHLRAGEVLREVKNVAEVGPAEAVNALCIVADGRHIVMDGGEEEIGRASCREREGSVGEGVSMKS